MMNTRTFFLVLMNVTFLICRVSAAADAPVRFLALGKPSAIRIQGTAKTLESEKPAWKDGKFSGTYHVLLNELETGISMRDRHMKEKYLEVEKFPKADLMLSDCPVKLGESKCEGQVTLHGVTQKVPLNVAWSRGSSSDEWLAHSRFILKLSEFGIKIPTFANITVAEDVTVEVDSSVKEPKALVSDSAKTPSSPTQPQLKN
ncbi:MAG: YceI family protein [Cryobacterium sp.]|nr:YceI family protein [Oligoflexia bacterium]